jgi:hypothetical protein
MSECRGDSIFGEVAGWARELALNVPLSASTYMNKINMAYYLLGAGQIIHGRSRSQKSQKRQESALNEFRCDAILQGERMDLTTRVCQLKGGRVGNRNIPLCQVRIWPDGGHTSPPRRRMTRSLVCWDDATYNDTGAPTRRRMYERKLNRALVVCRPHNMIRQSFIMINLFYRTLSETFPSSLLLHV